MDPIVELLVNKYGVPRAQASDLAQQIVAGKITGSRELEGEAASGEANDAIQGLNRLKYYNDLARRFYNGDGVSEDEFNYLDSVHKALGKRALEQAGKNKIAGGVGAGLPAGAVSAVMGMPGAPDPATAPPVYSGFTGAVRGSALSAIQDADATVAAVGANGKR